MSAIAYCEEAFAILRANLAAELARIQDAHTALILILNDAHSHKGAALDQARIVDAAIKDAAMHYEPTVEQARQAGKPSHPATPKPAFPVEPVPVPVPATLIVKPAPAPLKKK